VISIIVVNTNGKEIIGECLNSLLNQSLNDNIEILVVDNGSADLSYEYISEKFPKVKLIKFSEKIGFAKANNEALKIAQGEFIALLNNSNSKTKIETYPVFVFIIFPDTPIKSPASIYFLNNFGIRRGAAF